MAKIAVELRYREICAIKHALEYRIEEKYKNLHEGITNEEQRKRLKEIVDETVLINSLDKVLEKHKR